MRPIDADKLIEDFEHDIAIDEDILGYEGSDLQTRENAQYDKDCKQNAIDWLMRTPTIKNKQIKYYDEADQVWKIGEVIVNSSEKPNNCEHITEDGVTCAKYPACDDCLDNPLNKVKGSERLLKGKTEPRICDTCRYYNSYIPCGSTPSACKEADKFAEEFVDGLKKLKPKVEPQTDEEYINSLPWTEVGNGEQTDFAWK